MATIIRSKIKCPYCEFENSCSIEADKIGNRKEVYTCNISIGGCNRDFVLHKEIILKTETFKIERQD